MSRPSKAAGVDLSRPHELTASLIDRLSCPPGKSQVFLRDLKVPGLAVRCTANGAKSYIFEASLHGQTIRLTIGDVRIWPLDNPKRVNKDENQSARDEARRHRITISAGNDPRPLHRRRVTNAPRRGAITGLDAWALYINEGKHTGFTKRGPWGERHYQDHIELSSAGGQPKKRGSGKTSPGPLYPVLSKPLAQISQTVIAKFLEQENRRRPARASLAFRLLAAFLNWCGRHPEYRSLVDPKIHEAPEIRRHVRETKAKRDSLQREQLPVFFDALTKLNNHAASTYVQSLLLTGARPGEMLGLKWEDVDLKWRSMAIRDKLDGSRAIPLTPYLAHLLSALPRKGAYVFAGDSGQTKPMEKPHRLLAKACKLAGIESVTFHGLRRSFKNLSEWLEVPAGVVAQLMGHKPSATAERHYTNRPIDLLRIHHENIERWIVEQAHIKFDYLIAPTKLRSVK